MEDIAECINLPAHSCVTDTLRIKFFRIKNVYYGQILVRLDVFVQPIT